MSSSWTLGAKARDALAEVGNIGTGNAVTALSSMIGGRIDMDLPTIRILPFGEIPTLLGGAETMQVGILLEIEGDLKGMFMFLLSEGFAREMLRSLLGEEPQDVMRLDEMNRSAVCEIGNILCCAYINALAKMMDVRVQVSVPDMCSDMAGALLSVPMIRFATLSEELIFIENRFRMGDVAIVSHVLFLPEFESIERILQALGVDDGR